MHSHSYSHSLDSCCSFGPCPCHSDFTERQSWLPHHKAQCGFFSALILRLLCGIWRCWLPFFLKLSSLAFHSTTLWFSSPLFALNFSKHFGWIHILSLISHVSIAIWRGHEEIVGVAGSWLLLRLCRMLPDDVKGFLSLEGLDIWLCVRLVKVTNLVRDEWSLGSFFLHREILAEPWQILPVQFPLIL